MLVQTSASSTNSSKEIEKQELEIGVENTDYPPTQSEASTLAQIFSRLQLDSHSCTYSQDRTKAALENDFYSNYSG